MGAALCAMMASCQQDEGSLGVPQVNPQGSVLEGASGVAVTLAPGMEGVINLGDLAKVGENAPLINVVSIVPAETMPQGGVYTAQLQVASKADYSDARVLNLDNGAENSTNYGISPVALYDAFTAYYSKYEVAQKPLYARVAVYAYIPASGIDSGMNLRMGGVNYWYLDKTELKCDPNADASLIFYTPGANGQDAVNSMRLMQNEDYWFGFVNVTAPFTLENLDGSVKLGAGASAGALTTTSTTKIAVPAEGAGLYFVKLTKTDDTNYGIEFTLINSVSCIGDFNSWGGDAALTPNADKTVWSGDVDFTAAGGWKFRMNNDWAVNLGGEMNCLIYNAGNLSMDNTGVYHVVLDIAKVPYTCTVTAK